MESETQRIALGLRQGDVVVLEALVEQYQYRLVRYLVSLLGRRDGVDDLVQETWLRVLERVGRTTGSPALNLGSSGWRAILLSMPCVSDRCSVWTQMRGMVFAHRLLPVSLRHTRLRRGHKMPSGLPTRCKLWSPSIAKPSYCAFKKIYLYRRYL